MKPQFVQNFIEICRADFVKNNSTQFFGSFLNQPFADFTIKKFFLELKRYACGKF